MGYFHASKLLKLAFLSSLMRKYVLWKGFYQLSIKKASFSAPWTPTGGAAPWPPKVLRPLTIYPGAAPANTSQKKKRRGGEVAQVARI